MFAVEKPDILQQGERARLIPTIKDSNLEQKVTSSLLASLMAVEEFGAELLNEVGVRIGKRAKITCFTEVVFKGQKDDAKTRPDGLIVVDTGAKKWMALVEAKIGANELKREQIESYLDLAKQYKVDALITLSNQFTNLPTHHPIQVDKRKTKSVGLYHWSWTRVVTHALLLAGNKNVSDPDQAYLLEELIRFLQHPNSGVLSFSRMGSGWKKVCQDAHQNIPLKKTGEEIGDVISSWNQLMRNMAFELSVPIGRIVSIYMTNAQKKNPKLLEDETTTALVDNKLLSTQFEIPDAASRITYEANLTSRSLSASMRLEAPRDKQHVKSRINWLIRQLSKCNDDSIAIRVEWPGRAAPGTYSLGELRNDVSLIEPPSPKALPHHFEVVRFVDLAGKFSAPKVFVEEALKLLPSFYNDVGQHLKAWVAPPPKVKKKEVTEESTKLNQA